MVQPETQLGKERHVKGQVLTGQQYLGQGFCVRCFIDHLNRMKPDCVGAAWGGIQSIMSPSWIVPMFSVFVGKLVES